ncbi:MAG: response regulator [Burkholderiaceae bacterium]
MVQTPHFVDQPGPSGSYLTTPDAASGESAAESFSVLLVDGSAFFGKALSNALSRIPRVKVVGISKQAAEVLPAVTRLRPDLVILDLAFGNTGVGRGLLQELVALTRAPKVIVLTDDSGPLVSAHVLATGAFAHFDKSLETAALINQVASLALLDH